MNNSSSAVALNPYDYRIHRPIIYTVVSVFTVLGTFGNLQLIAVHLRKATLRTKYGILLCSLSTFQTLCLFFEWVGVVYTLINPVISRPGCYRLLFFYVFVHCMQTGILATISADLLISIVLPVKHRTWRHYPYCLLICLPAMAYGLISVALGFIFLDDAAIQMCNPPNSLQKTANEFWYFGALLAGGIVIANYALAYAIINVKSRRDRAPMETERRAMRSLSVILFVFVFSRYIGVLVSNLLIFTNADPALISLYQSYNAFFAMALYSQNFYVCYWRSSDYRHHLKEQIVLSLLWFFPTSSWLIDRLPPTPLFTIKSRGHSLVTSK